MTHSVGSQKNQRSLSSNKNSDILSCHIHHNRCEIIVSPLEGESPKMNIISYFEEVNLVDNAIPRVKKSSITMLMNIQPNTMMLTFPILGPAGASVIGKTAMDSTTNTRIKINK